MRPRKLTAVSNGDKVATVYRDPEWNEYVVKLKGQPRADYHTDDRADAEATARRMVGFAGRLGDHDPRKVWAASQRVGMRAVGEKRFKIDVKVFRYQGGFTAQACIPKGPTRIMGGRLLRRVRHRCGTATSKSPTAAVRGALTRLTSGA